MTNVFLFGLFAVTLLGIARYHKYALQIALAGLCLVLLTRVLLTVATTNLASIRIIEGNGGALDGTSISPRTGEVMRRYWIEL